MAQALFHASEHRLVVTGLDVDDAIRDQACLRERRGKKVRPGQTPKHFAPASRRHPGAKQCRGRAVDGAVASTCDFVEGSQCQSAARQARVDGRDSERQHRPTAGASALDPLDLVAERLKYRLWPQLALPARTMLDVPLMFSVRAQESSWISGANTATRWKVGEVQPLPPSRSNSDVR